MTKVFVDHVAARDARVEVLVWVGPAVEPIRDALVATFVDGVALESDPVVDVVAGREVGDIDQLEGRLLKVALELGAVRVLAAGPELVVDDLARLDVPCHAHLEALGLGREARLLGHGLAEQRAVVVADDERRDGDVTAVAVVRHEGEEVLLLAVFGDVARKAVGVVVGVRVARARGGGTAPAGAG